MHTTTASVLVIALLALVVIGFFAVFRHRGKARLKGPFGTQLDVEGTNERRPGVRGKDLTSKTGGLTARDETGAGIDVEKVQVDKDIDLTSTGRSKERGPET